MDALDTSPSIDRVTPETARRELARFFSIARTADRAPEMFTGRGEMAAARRNH